MTVTTLPTGQHTVAVLITSDTDFVPQLRRLKARGGPVLAVHAAPPHSQQCAALSHAATEVTTEMLLPTITYCYLLLPTAT